MPIYVYRCPACGLEREMIRTIAERDVVPACRGELMNLCEGGAGQMERVAAPASFRVEGYSARNNYSKIDTGWKPAGGGIRTRVKGDHVDID